MARRSRSVSGSANRSKHPRSASVGEELRRSPRIVPKKNYYETRRHGSLTSSMGSTGRCERNSAHLSVSLEITMVNEEGEICSVGTRVFTLPQTAQILHVHLTPQPPVANEGLTHPPKMSHVQPNHEPPSFDYAGYLAKKHIRDKKLKKHDKKIKKLEAEYVELKRKEALYAQRKIIGETFGVKKDPWSGPLLDVMKEPLF